MPEIPEEEKKKQFNPHPFRIVTTCNVTLIGKTMYDDMTVDRWCADRGMEFETDPVDDADVMSEFAGRVCYLSFNEDRRRPAPEGEQNSTYLKHIFAVGHTSITEHASWNFLIDDFSKNCTQELVRHRVGVAYSVQSSRYVDQFSDEYFGDSGHTLGVYFPPEVYEDDELKELWVKHWLSTVDIYRRTFDKMRAIGLDKKDARSIARDCIPGSMCNALLFTANARILNHIFAMRGALPAHQEIRKLALRLYDHVKTSNLFMHWEQVEHPTKGRYLKIRQDAKDAAKKAIGLMDDPTVREKVMEYYGLMQIPVANEDNIDPDCFCDPNRSGL